MAAERFSSDVLERFYGPITEEEKINLPQPLEPDVDEIEPHVDEIQDEFLLVRNNFGGLLHVWRMNVSEGNENNNDLYAFARGNKAKFTDLVKREIRELKGAKVSFEMNVGFSNERNGKTEEKKHYFRQEEPYVFERDTDE